MDTLENEHNFIYAGRMDIHSNEVNSGGDFIERLIYFFSLSKQERLNAGIFIGWEGRDWLEKSALVIFSPPQEMDE